MGQVAARYFCQVYSASCCLSHWPALIHFHECHLVSIALEMRHVKIEMCCLANSCTISQQLFRALGYPMFRVAWSYRILRLSVTVYLEMSHSFFLFLPESPLQISFQSLFFQVVRFEYRGSGLLPTDTIRLVSEGRWRFF